MNKYSNYNPYYDDEEVSKIIDDDYDYAPSGCYDCENEKRFNKPVQPQRTFQQPQYFNPMPYTAPAQPVSFAEPAISVSAPLDFAMPAAPSYQMQDFNVQTLAAPAAVSVSPPYPGYPLTVGSTGANVSLMQTYLNAIRAQLYPQLNKLVVDGIYGNATRTTVMQYQLQVGLPADGVIGEATWNSIVNTYNSLPNPPIDVYPGTPLRVGSTGPYVANMQTKLNTVRKRYTAINSIAVDGNFGNNTYNAVVRFQKQFGLNADGVIGELTWNKIIAVYNAYIASTYTPVTTSYPGYVLAVGSSGDNVRFVQSYMSSVPDLPKVTIDGVFGTQTQYLVASFQNKYGLKVDAKVGSATWGKMIPVFNAL